MTADDVNGRVQGGTVTWACTTGFAPVFIFPFTPGDYYGVANLHEFQVLLYRPLYWYGSGGQPVVDYERSLGEPPEWAEDGRTVTVTIKPYAWSNGEVVNADNVLLWMHLLLAEKENFGGYTPGYFPDNVTSFAKVAEDKVSFTFDKAYSRNWVLMNQLSTITPLPRAWDRTEAGPADATHDPAQASAVYAYLRKQNDDRSTWDSSPIWSVVNGPWKLRTYTIDGFEGEAVLVRNDAYSGPNKAYLDEFRLIPTATDEEEYELLGKGGAQVGFLPFSKVTEPGDPVAGGPNPLSERYTLVPQLTYKIHYFPINFNNPTLAGKMYRQLYVRQAIQSCLDVDGAIRDIYKGYGYATTGPIPRLPDSPLISPAAHEHPYPFDVDHARAVLAENGWDTGQTPAVCVRPGTGEGEAGEGISAGDRLTFHLRYAKGHATLTQLMQKFSADAALAGIEITLEEVPANILVLEDTTCTPGPDSPCLWQFSDWNGGWGYGPAYYPTGEGLYGTGSPVNFGSYSDPKADELIARTVVSDDLSDLHEYQDYIARQLPVIWMPNFPFRLLEVDNNLRGVTPINPYGLINPEDWHYVEQ
ncbi:ABC transporter substrate-binding protein [Hamadaea tsunoensis]|uniref:ABC transporter substrate-binding protein n=1 Tax=Hamadaea tsunoensis TaxID=53368 RepID=UPI0003FE2580|nr:ABC transporter substrate-binding protein [Hamadaea tsunoensis]